VQHPRVQAGVVAAVGEPRGDRRLVAYVVPNREIVHEAGLSSGEVGHDHAVQHTEGVILDPIERLRFKLTHPGLRSTDGGEPYVQLARPELDEGLIEKFVGRRSYRQFEPGPIPLGHFGRFLGCLQQVEFQGVPLPKHRYGSAGSLYPVQVYVYVKAGGVEGIEGGAYYYHPAEHRLVLLSAEAEIDSAVYTDNGRIFEAAAFAVYLVGQMKAITPMYGEWARDFCVLEAGLITQLMESSAPAHEIGLCQIGGLDFEPIRDCFALGEGHVYLHSLLGGQVGTGQTGLQALVDESSELRLLLSLLEESEEKERAPGPLPVARAGSEAPVIEELRGFMQQKLPDYMLPSVFVLLEALPLTPNGKVDRNALLDLDTTGPETEKVFVAPQTELEQAVAAVWQEVLQVEKVGIYDNFFDLGGNSIHLVQAHSKLQKALGKDLSILKMFEHPTIDSLTQYLAQEQDHRPALQQSHGRAKARRASRRQRRKKRSNDKETSKGI
jgi:SagB-type dehydrogenase family enzyme